MNNIRQNMHKMLYFYIIANYFLHFVIIILNHEEWKRWPCRYEH